MKKDNKPKYKIFIRTNGRNGGLMSQMPFGFKEAIDFFTPRVFHGNDLIEFEIRPADSRVLDNHYVADYKESAYLVKINNKSVLLYWDIDNEKWSEMTAQEIDKWDGNNQINNKQETCNCGKILEIDEVGDKYCPVCGLTYNIEEYQDIPEDILPPIEEIDKNLINLKITKRAAFELIFLLQKHYAESVYIPNIIEDLKEKIKQKL